MWYSELRNSILDSEFQHCLLCLCSIFNVHGSLLTFPYLRRNIPTPVSPNNNIKPPLPVCWVSIHIILGSIPNGAGTMVLWFCSYSFSLPQALFPSHTPPISQMLSAPPAHSKTYRQASLAISQYCSRTSPI